MCIRGRKTDRVKHREECVGEQMMVLSKGKTGKEEKKIFFCMENVLSCHLCVLIDIQKLNAHSFSEVSEGQTCRLSHLQDLVFFSSNYSTVSQPLKSLLIIFHLTRSLSSTAGGQFNLLTCCA